MIFQEEKSCSLYGYLNAEQTVVWIPEWQEKDYLSNKDESGHAGKLKGPRKRVSVQFRNHFHAEVFVLTGDFLKIVSGL